MYVGCTRCNDDQIKSVEAENRDTRGGKFLERWEVGKEEQRLLSTMKSP